jgi:N utilization substance protein A
VPEIYDGIIQIKSVARDPGSRAKIAVISNDSSIDPVGACVGMRGSRVQAVVGELQGEKIDNIPWNPEPARFVAKALSPARVREVYLDDEARDATVVVPDDQLALAIGKEGLNARLAARLTGWKVDIKSDSEFAQQEADAAFAGADEGAGDFSGRCAALLSNGKRCPNAALPGTRYCGVPAHQALADDPTAAERGAAVPLSDGSAAASGDDETETESAGGVATEVAVADAPFEAIEGALADVELTAEAAESAEASPGDGAEEARGDA